VPKQAKPRNRNESRAHRAMEMNPPNHFPFFSIFNWRYCVPGLVEQLGDRLQLGASLREACSTAGCSLLVLALADAYALLFSAFLFRLLYPCMLTATDVFVCVCVCGELCRK